MNTIKHFVTITKHKIEVGKMCFKSSLYWQGITHDLSKYSPIEFWSSVKYYQGDSSPIDAEKKDKGYSLAWLNHRGRNKHHWEYWIDNLSEGGKPLKIPYKYCIEMICDWIGAGKVYLGDKYTREQTLKFFDEKYNTRQIILHPHTYEFIRDTILRYVNIDGRVTHKNKKLENKFKYEYEYENR